MSRTVATEKRILTQIEPLPEHFDYLEAVPAGEYYDKGIRITLKVQDFQNSNSFNKWWLDRVVLKTDTCEFSIPELELVIPDGKPKFGPLKSFFEEIQENLQRSAVGSSSALSSVLDFLEDVLKGTKTCTVVLDDPLGNSAVQVISPSSNSNTLLQYSDDPNVTVVHYQRSAEQNAAYDLPASTSGASAASNRSKSVRTPFVTTYEEPVERQFGKFTVPTQEERARAIGADLASFAESLAGATSATTSSTSEMLLSHKKAFTPYPASCFKPVLGAHPGEWLYEQEEDGQPYDSFTSFNPVKGSTRNTIYLIPFAIKHNYYDEGEQATPKKLEYIFNMKCLVEYLECFFTGMRVKLIDRQTEKTIDKQIDTSVKWRTNPYSLQKQLLTKGIFQVINNYIPEDAYCVIGVTMTDLYPDEKWNFVFGQASLKKRYGVFSFARYDPNFYSPTERSRIRTMAVLEDQQEIKKLVIEDLLLLSRSCAVAAHEIGHMFAIEHCVYYNCLMNGSNSLQESDKQMMELCPVCLRKLHKVIGFDPVQRYHKLKNFFGTKIHASYWEQFLDEEQQKFTSVDAFAEEAKWVQQRLDFVEQ